MIGEKRMKLEITVDIKSINYSVVKIGLFDFSIFNHKQRTKDNVMHIITIETYKNNSITETFDTRSKAMARINELSKYM